MTKQIEALKLAEEALDLAQGSHGVMLMSDPPHDAWVYRGVEHRINKALAAIREVLIEPKCSDHPDAPHGFDRNASHSADRYVCECEGWEPPIQEPVAWVSIEALAAERYKVVPSHDSMFYRHAVIAGDGKQQLYIGREVECENMARKFAGAFLDGAFFMQNEAPVQPVKQEPVAWILPKDLEVLLALKEKCGEITVYGYQRSKFATNPKDAAVPLYL